MNKGERNELLIKLRLIEMRDNNILFMGSPIKQLGYSNNNYSALPSNISLKAIKNNDQAIVSLCNQVGITKAPNTFKSDVYINNKGYSLKSFSGANPAIVNHTARPGFEMACTYSNVSINQLDNIIDNYWSLRNAGTIREDVHNYIGTTLNTSSPFVYSQAYMTPILNYFLFEGSGRGASPHPATFVLDFTDPLDDSTWAKYDSTNFISNFWNKLVFSVRATKGMPKNYNPNTYQGNNALSIQRWVQLANNKYRGALHVRVKR